MMDRGDAPAQVVIEKTLKAQSERRTEETKEQLVKITDRVEQVDFISEFRGAFYLLASVRKRN